MDEEKNIRILTPEETAELLKTTPNAVKAAARNGKLPARKICGHWRFIELDIINHIRAGYTGAGSDVAKETRKSWQKSTKEPTVNTTGHTSQNQTEDIYANLLASVQSKTPKNGRQKLRLISGGKQK